MLPSISDLNVKKTAPNVAKKAITFSINIKI